MTRKLLIFNISCQLKQLDKATSFLIMQNQFGKVLFFNENLKLLKMIIFTTYLSHNVYKSNYLSDSSMEVHCFSYIILRVQNYYTSKQN